MKNKNQKKTKALSLMVGYVLLVVFALVLGVIVYNFLKTYVPQDEINCPDGTSILIESYDYDCVSNVLIFDIANNGRFDIDGYFIYATDDPNQGVATVVISQNNSDEYSKIGDLEIKLGGYTIRNEFSPGDKETERYTLEGTADQIYSIEILPVREQTENRRKLLVACKDARIKKEITCT